VPICTGAENLAPTGIRSPDRLARSELLYRLSYPGSSEVEYPLLSSAKVKHGQSYTSTSSLVSVMGNYGETFIFAFTYCVERFYNSVHT
jgi:hypothetical protein